MHHQWKFFSSSSPSIHVMWMKRMWEWKTAFHIILVHACISLSFDRNSKQIICINDLKLSLCCFFFFHTVSIARFSYLHRQYKAEFNTNDGKPALKPHRKSMCLPCLYGSLVRTVHAQMFYTHTHTENVAIVVQHCVSSFVDCHCICIEHFNFQFFRNKNCILFSRKHPIAFRFRWPEDMVFSVFVEKSIRCTSLFAPCTEN